MERSDEARRLDCLYSRISQKNKRIRELEAKLKEKDELLFAYESVRTPIKENINGQ